MFYKYDDKQLMFVKNKLGVKIALGTTVLLMVGSFFIGRHFQSDTLDTIENKIKIINLQKEKDSNKIINFIKMSHPSLGYVLIPNFKINGETVTNEQGFCRTFGWGR